MKKIRLVYGVLTVVLLALSSCTNEESGPSAGVGVVSGYVRDASNRSPLAGVVVEGRVGTDVTTTATTDLQGRYELRFEVDSATTARISIRNYTGYRDTLDITVTVRPNEATLKDIDLKAKSQVVGSGGTSSGLAQTIAFLGADPTQVSVRGVGGQETSVLGFEARDSLGLAIDGAHAIQIQFSLQGGPGGGEYLSPTLLTTNAVGRAYVTFNSGTRSGVVQVVATATVGSRTIVSSPVRIVINAGFPDQAHFTIAAERFNFPTLGIAGRRNRISVIVGDRYSNPVAEGTAVYFSTSAGVIQPAVFTNTDGQGSADLISGNPAPFGQYAAPEGDGYHYVVARTIGEGGVQVKDSVLILWSGRSTISNINPSSFTIPNGGYVDFTFTVSDYLGHPLAAGTSIRVQASVPPPPDPNSQVNQVQLAFGRDGAIVLEDFRFPGPGTTDFGFRLSDGTPDPNVLPSAVSISISVDGPNGNAYLTINGTCN